MDGCREKTEGESNNCIVKYAQQTSVFPGNLFSMCRVLPSSFTSHCPHKIPPGWMLVLLLVQSVGWSIFHVVFSQPCIHNADGTSVGGISMHPPNLVNSG